MYRFFTVLTLGSGSLHRRYGFWNWYGNISEYSDLEGRTTDSYTQETYIRFLPWRRIKFGFFFFFFLSPSSPLRVLGTKTLRFRVLSEEQG